MANHEPHTVLKWHTTVRTHSISKHGLLNNHGNFIWGMKESSVQLVRQKRFVPPRSAYAAACGCADALTHTLKPYQYGLGTLWPPIKSTNT